MRGGSIAKISRPKLSNVFNRERLYRLLDQRRERPVIWIAAQAGSGKTTLVSSWIDSRKLPCIWYQIDEGDGDIASFFYYMGMASKKAAPRHKRPLPLLTPEYLQGIPVFTRRYFEELFRRLKSPCVVVLDNYQEISPASGFHDMLVHGLDTVPEGITLIILSRLSPPPMLSRLQANNRLHLIEWEELRFNREESRGLLEKQGHDEPTPEALELLYSNTEGWAAGLILLTAGAGTAASSPVGMTVDGLFDYFASEIFSKTDATIQDVLLKTSFLQKIDPVIAEKLTENGMAGQILERMSRDHYFTQNYGMMYQYHPLFRAFLLSRMKESFSPDDIHSLQIRTAGLLAESGQPEDAASLYRDARDWEKFIRLVLGNAQSLFAQGRIATLTEWLTGIPPEIVNSVPWLLYWKGICKLPYVPKESREYLDQSFRLFEAQGDQVGVFLAWSSAVQTFMIEIDDFRPLDPWIEWLDGRDRRGLSFPSPEIEAMTASGMIGALRWRRPNHPNIRKWVNGLLTLSKKDLSINTYLRACINCEYYYFWMGEFAECALLINEMESILKTQPTASPLMGTMLKTLAALLYNTSLKSNDQAIRSASEGIEIAQRTGVHLMDPLLFVMRVISALNEGDLMQAQKYLTKAEGAIGNDRRADSFPYAFLSVWYNLVAGDPQKTVALAKKTVALAEKIGSPIYTSLIQLVLALALYETGETSEAIRQLVTAKGYVVESGSAFFEYLFHLTEAYFAFEQKNDHDGLEALSPALSWGRQKGYFSMVFFWRPVVLSRLSLKALEAGIEMEYVQNYIRKMNLIPEHSSPVTDTWPWSIKIYTLGRFELVKDGEPVKFSGKVQQKPLALLKALIAFGGTDVAEDRITDAVWPEAPGDSAHKSFETALNRLRKLLGDDRAIQLSHSRLTLDPDLCWVDLCELERAIALAETAWLTRLPERISDAMKHTDRAIDLHRGAFLPAEDRHPWTHPVRENVSRRMLRLLSQAAAHFQGLGESEKALVYLEKGFSIDDLSEEMVQRLVLCNHHLGRKAEAIRLFHQWRDRLSASLGIEPGVKSQEIYRSIVKD